MGCGKSLVYVTAALALGLRVSILTESKFLQDQLQKDFGSAGLFDMRGMSNYTCHALARGGIFEDMWVKKWGKPKCDVGPCMAGHACQLKNDGCDYFDNYRRACTAKLVSSNYAYWIAIHKYGQGLGKFDMLVLDEAHAADGALRSMLTVEFTEKDFKELGSKPPAISSALQNWRMWARVQLAKIVGKLEIFSESANAAQGVGDDGVAMFVSDTDLPDAAELKLWKKLESKCRTLTESTDKWVIEQSENGTIKIAPVWVREHGESMLFLGIPRIVLMSATVRPKVRHILGIPDGEWEYHEYPSTFPVERRPLYWIPTVRLNHSTPEDDLRTWVVRIDQIISRRLDRKGIIHTRSYVKQRYLMANSRFRHLMLGNATGTTKEVVKKFRDAEAPSILVSPSVGTGFDFKFDEARYQIIAKVPYLDKRGAIISAQDKEDPEYVDSLVAQELIQIYGRTTRDVFDWSETFIVDNCIDNFLKWNKRHFPDYFLEAYQPIDGVPDPPALEAVAVC